MENDDCSESRRRYIKMNSKTDTESINQYIWTVQIKIEHIYKNKRDVD